jgi:sugar phosphate isomerase/epimerase
MEKSRREFIRMTAATTMGAVMSKELLASPAPKESSSPLCVFTKCLQFLDFDQTGELLSNAGFTGADLPVRPDGSVHPDNVEKELPEAVRILKKHGIEVPMAVTAINNADDPLTERVLGALSQAGIRFYRTGYLLYDPSKTIQENLENHKRTFEKLERLNRKFNLHGAYQNHSGTRLGGPVWDLYWIVKDLDPAYFGIQYDFCHAMCEGGVSWPLGMKLLAPWIKMVDIKDHLWSKVDGKWKIVYVPLGKGMVDFDLCLKQYEKYNLSGPVSMHFEYDLGGAELGKKNPRMSREEIASCLKRDSQWFKEQLSKHSMM